MTSMVQNKEVELWRGLFLLNGSYGDRMVDAFDESERYKIYRQFSDYTRLNLVYEKKSIFYKIEFAFHRLARTNNRFVRVIRMIVLCSRFAFLEGMHFIEPDPSKIEA